MKESDIQKCVISQFRVKYPELCWSFIDEKKKLQKCQWLKASMNGAAYMKSSSVAYRVNTIVSLKKQGMLIGEADLELPIPNKKYNGLFIELKTKKNKPLKTVDGRQSKGQIEFEVQAKKIGWNYVLCRSIESAMSAIEQHLLDSPL